MLIDYPVKFGDEEIPEPESWSEESSVIENVNQTEAGTDQISSLDKGHGTHNPDAPGVKEMPLGVFNISEASWTMSAQTA